VGVRFATKIGIGGDDSSPTPTVANTDDGFNLEIVLSERSEMQIRGCYCYSIEDFVFPSDRSCDWPSMTLPPFPACVKEAQ